LKVESERQEEKLSILKASSGVNGLLNPLKFTYSSSHTPFSLAKATLHFSSRFVCCVSLSDGCTVTDSFADGSTVGMN
jgi:hypothetical protein